MLTHQLSNFFLTQKSTPTKQGADITTLVALRLPSSALSYPIKMLKFTYVHDTLIQLQEWTHSHTSQSAPINHLYSMS